MSTLTQLFTSIANAIRAKKGTQALIEAEDFPNEIDTIQTGITPTGTIDITQNGITDVTNYANASVNVKASGGEKDVNFYDYDGTLVDSYTKAEFLELNEMPANPTHDRMIGQGWNWTLSQAKDYLTYYDKLQIGQIYTTTSGKTEFDIVLNKATGLAFTLNMAGTKDWGDGTIDTATSHTYASYGEYTVTCDGTEISSTLIFGQASNKRNGSVIRARIANVTSISANAFQYCGALETITFSNDVIALGNNILEECRWLQAMIIPTSITEIPQYFCRNDYMIKILSIAPSVTKLNQYAFYGCSNLRVVTLPKETATLQTGYVFQNCYALELINLSFDMTTLTTYSLGNCYGLKKLDFSNFTSVPSFGTGAISLGKASIIIVPDNLYNTWITASGWSGWASYIVKASEV